MKILLNDPNYNPDAVLDFAASVLGCRNDHQLAHRLGMDPAQVHRARKRREGISSEMLLRMHEASGVPIAQLRRLMGVSSPVECARAEKDIRVVPEIIARINQLPRHFLSSGALHSGAIGRNGYIKYPDVLALLEHEIRPKGAA